MKKITLLKPSFLIFMILTISFLGFSKEKALKSTWSATPVNIDGADNDWAQVALTTNRKVSVDYAFKNDAASLYVLFIFRNKKYLSSIGATGMTLWFSSEKKKKNYGLKFIQRKISADALIARLEKEKGPLPEEEKNRIRANRSYVMYDAEEISKKKKSQPPEKGKKEPGIFRFLKQQNSFVFEFSIPMKRIMENIPGIENQTSKSIKVGFEWGGMTKEMKAALMKRRAALSRTRTMQNDSTSNMAGAGAGSSVPIGSIAGPPKYDFWVNVQLAQNQ